jgi:hypothetical protein
MKRNLPLFFLFFAFKLSAQIPNGAELHAQFDQIGKAQTPSTVPTFDTRYEGVLGSRFYVENYNNGEIWLTDGHHYTTELQYRFDEIENKIQVKYPDGKELLLFNNYVTKCHVFNKDTTIIYQKAFIEGEKDIHKLYQVLCDDSIYTLLKFPQRKMTRIDEKTALTIGRLYDKITPFYHYYFFEKGDKKEAVFKEIKLKKKEIIKFLPTQKTTLENLFKAPQYSGDFDESKLIFLFKNLKKQ